MSNFKQQSFLMPVLSYSCRWIELRHQNKLFERLPVIVILVSFLLYYSASAQKDKCTIPFSLRINIDSLKKILPSLQGGTRIDCLNALGEAYVGSQPDWFDRTPSKTEFDTAKSFTLKALEEAKKINYNYGIAKALSLRA